ncbi:MAG TPA: hypothetical protein PKD19_04530 [Candidatus Saccharibacteria bacterium]|nr:hypothetical protein [Candidatus Saccharibacteria bacterium]HMR38192.1 hypothetical protein [Candidatus Saccharibacteria bacterium]
MGLFGMLANFDPDKIVKGIESAEKKLDSFIDSGNAAVNKVQGAADVIDKKTGSSGSAASASDDTSQDADDTTSL